MLFILKVIQRLILVLGFFLCATLLKAEEVYPSTIAVENCLECELEENHYACRCLYADWSDLQWVKSMTYRNETIEAKCASSLSSHYDYKGFLKFRKKMLIGIFSLLSLHQRGAVHPHLLLALMSLTVSKVLYVSTRHVEVTIHCEDLKTGLPLPAQEVLFQQCPSAKFSLDMQCVKDAETSE